MSEYSSVIVLGAFVATIVIWNVGFKRNIGEAMFAGFVVTAAFAGSEFSPLCARGSSAT